MADSAFLRMSSLPRRRKMQLRGLPPPMASLASLEHSVVTLVLEYYSFVMSGRAPRLKLLRSLKYANFEEWASKETALRDSLRRGVVVASAWVFARSFHRLLRPPWVLAAIVDTRQSDEYAREVIDLFNTAPLR